ncbi:PRC-barrel domain-containing protein [Loktanella fryxellensis]|uniref:PRC-barrel domain-containing protein n=1 Tax=Loktanella fryxellensis TaxID=245187 RepID=A0A1H8CYR6_9RHOB|nr:PRC-barrel domain-containing protein [Loktanella fryxellensis]SEM99554.1 PRC-barrel domain-containing protein [Loktanella fryxellensis]
MDTDTNLITTDRVNGANVYGADREKIGHIDHLLIDKPSGNVAYAVMNYGGFLGMGAEEHPLPWKSLRYDRELDGYVTNLTNDQLTGAPERSEDWNRNRDYETRLHDHYGMPGYWA